MTENVPSHRNDDSFVTQLNWDEETDSTPRDRVAPHGKSYPPRHRRITKPARSSQRRENTPLLRALSSPSSRGSLSPVGRESYQTYRSIVRPERRISSAPTQSVQPQFHVGQSTFGQSVRTFSTMSTSCSPLLIVIQHHGNIARHRCVIRALGICLHWLDWGNNPSHLLRIHILLHVRASEESAIWSDFIVKIQGEDSGWIYLL